MNILFYTISNKRSRDIESQAIAFAEEGHTIFLLTQSARSPLHDVFESKKFKAYHSVPVKTFFPIYLIIESVKLIYFCYRHRITVVHAHLDPCCQIAVWAEKFIQSKVIVTRHHADALRYETTEINQRISRNIYAKANSVIAVSQNVKQFMVEEEHIQADKIVVIPLSYNFDLFEKPSEVDITTVRNQYPASILFSTVGRFTSLKRIDLIIEFIGRLVSEGIDCKLMIVGHGPDELSLRQKVEELGLTNSIYFIGFSNNVLTYLAAADYNLHFSITETGCTVVKEAALVGTPVIVCQGVGDFDQYIRHKENSYLISKFDPVNDAMALLHEIYPNESLRKQVGEQLKQTVLSSFAIEQSMLAYRELHDKILNR